jgi:ethanolaminephosphotransferase
MFRYKYLSEKALLGLKNYKYKSGEYSTMDKVMTPFWNKAVEVLPMWMAPNLVTLIGFIAIVLAACQYLPYDLSLTKSFEPWCYAFSALSIFIYQTLDAIDGKQARRTGTSSPLGQLFDHGLDAWSTVFTVYSPMQILRAGTTVPFFIYSVGLMSGFYTANWEEYHTEVLRTSINGVGLTECQLALMGVLLF